MAGNGGVVGPVNTVVNTATPISQKITQITSSGDFTVQCAPVGGTRTGAVLVVAGGGSNGGCGGGRPGGGGAGGFRLLSCQTFSTSAIPVTIGGGEKNKKTLVNHKIQYQQPEGEEVQLLELFQEVLVVEVVVTKTNLVVLEMQEDILLQKEIMVEVELKHQAHGEVVVEVELVEQVVLVVDQVELVLQQHQYLDQHLNLFI